MADQSEKIWADWEEYNHGLQGTATGSVVNQQGVIDGQSHPTRKNHQSNTVKQKRVQSKRNRNAKVKSNESNDFNVWFAGIALIITTSYLYSPVEQNGVAALIVGTITAALCGKYWKFIIGLAIIIGVVFFLATGNEGIN